jgi:hypothetical protein
MFMASIAYPSTIRVVWFPFCLFSISRTFLVSIQYRSIDVPHRFRGFERNRMSRLSGHGLVPHWQCATQIPSRPPYQWHPVTRTMSLTYRSHSLENRTRRTHSQSNKLIQTPSSKHPLKLPQRMAHHEIRISDLRDPVQATGSPREPNNKREISYKNHI